MSDNEYEDVELGSSLRLSEQAKEAIYGDDWTSSTQDKLEEWKVEAEKWSDWHDKARATFTWQRDCMNIPIIAFSGLTTIMLGIKSLQSASAGIIDPLSVATLCMSGLTTFISGVNAFYSPAERVQKHIDASNAFGSLARSIDYTISLPPKKRPDVEVSYVCVTKTFDAIGSQAPPVPRDLRK